jgi:uncharacterized protein YqhQ
MQAMINSATTAFEIEGDDGKPEKIEFGYAEIALLVAAVAGIMAVFFLVPYLLSGWLGLKAGSIPFNVAEAVIRLSMFVGYLSVISLWSQYKRVLMYHGAEHKAIHAHEAGVPMDVEHVRGFSRLHPRCGTSFLFIVVIISIILFTVSTRVILGHAGQSHLFRKRLRSLIAALALLILATIARVGADFIPPARNSHLVYAALIWLLAATVWFVALGPKLSVSGDE